MYKNDQATIKTRYCGHLYSPLLQKWTCLDQRDQLFYCKERGLILEAWRVTFLWPCRVSRCRSSPPWMGLWGMIVTFRQGWKGAWATLLARLFSRPCRGVRVRRDIVDTFTHPFCENGRVWIKETSFSTIRREDWYWKLEGSLFCGLVGSLGVGPLLYGWVYGHDSDISTRLKGGLSDIVCSSL
jgi:hypothetical protein